MQGKDRGFGGFRGHGKGFRDDRHKIYYHSSGDKRRKSLECAQKLIEDLININSSI